MDHTLLSGHGHQAQLCGISLKCDLCLFPKSTVYICMECYVYMCEVCFKFPQEISHWLHPEHPLSMKTKSLGRYICQGCNYTFLSSTYYKCEQCEVYICVECCTSSTSKRPLRWENKKVLHYTDVHELIKCRFRDDDEYYRCMICEVRLWGVGYACLKCKHFVHESCIETPRLIQYPFHPLHPLKRPDCTTPGLNKKLCNFCKKRFTVDNYCAFACEECKFYLHFHCADSPLRAIKLECHTHRLAYVSYLVKLGDIKCHLCYLDVSPDRQNFFRCVQCDFVVHFDCVSIPQWIMHRYHQHTLTLIDPFDDHSSEESYCDICEGRRHPKSDVYCCEPCKFFGHIECALTKEEGFPQFLSSLWAKKPNKVESVDYPDYPGKNQIRLVSHNHPLSLAQASGRLCQMCKIEINEAAYTCERCRNFWVHKKCAALPENLDHPLHPNHKLSLLTSSPRDNNRDWFICHICRDISKGFNFFCRVCGFVIDIKCVLGIQSGQPSYENEGWENTLRHPAHKCQLNLANSQRKFLRARCKICVEEISGLFYCCSPCGFFVHKSCLEWPSVVERHPLLPQNVLQLISIPDLRFLGTSYEMMCFACGDSVIVLGYNCLHQEHQVFFHLECGTSSAGLLKHKFHDHHLYYLQNRPHKGNGTPIQSFNSLVCTLCQEKIKGSYYRCLKCKLYFHLGCLQLPHTAKHKWHLHWLTFKESVEFGGYYCDICEEPRDSQHPVYCCQQCEFVACVNCIISEESASSVILGTD